MYSFDKNPVGIYEKAFPPDYSWSQILIAAKQAGYDFVEMSIDESPVRLDRLKWDPAQRAVLRNAINDTGIPIWGMGISAHRKYPLGSANSELRHAGLDILYRSIELAAELGIRVIQVMGYDVFYESHNVDTEGRFIEGLIAGTQWASAAGVLLALENVDTICVDSAEKAMRIVNLINSPWFQVYPDIGNMTAAGFDPLEQLPLTKGHLVGVHVKDTRKNELRGVNLGEGIVRFPEVFKWLASHNFSGPLVMEMWAELDRDNDPIGSLTHARQILAEWIDEAWLGSNRNNAKIQTITKRGVN